MNPIQFALWLWWLSRQHLHHNLLQRVLYCKPQPTEPFNINIHCLKKCAIQLPAVHMPSERFMKMAAAA